MVSLPTGSCGDAASFSDAGGTVEYASVEDLQVGSAAAMICEFDLGTPLVTHVTPVMTDRSRGDVRGGRGLYRRLS